MSVERSPPPAITATAAPTPTLPPSASPVPVAVFFPLLVALIETTPDVVIALPVPIRALVVTSRSASATTASIAMPPSEPALASVTVEMSEFAVTEMPAPPLNSAPSSILASADAVTKFKATDAPMPTLPPLVPLSSSGAAVAVAVICWSAETTEVPVPASTIEVPEMDATLEESIKFSAKAPAIPTFVPPAPDLADVIKLST